MKLFKCQHCGQIIYFENQKCEKCGRRLGYMPEAALLSALEPQENAWRALAANGRLYRLCANAEFDVCNWLVDDVASDNSYCVCCEHNRTIPDVSIQANLIAWRKIEAAKHRLFYTLLKLRLPLAPADGIAGEKLIFDFLAAGQQGGPKVMTGHEDGLITLALDEADDVEREKRRSSMHEPYRTLLGHFRHEVGHYYWDRLVRDGDKLEPIRQVFGDERIDYEQALKRHYSNGAPANWQQGFVSSYATSHPWEDFAETWAHYLHIVDTLEMTAAFGLVIHPALANSGDLDAKVTFDPYGPGGRRFPTWQKHLRRSTFSFMIPSKISISPRKQS
jgi:hypothetical protein